MSVSSPDRRGPSRPLTGKPRRRFKSDGDGHSDECRRWQDTIDARIGRARTCLQHNEKRATTFGIVALVLGAFGSAMIINRIAESSAAATVVGSVRFGHGSVGTALMAVALGFVMVVLYYNEKTHRDEQDIADLQFEHDLLRHAVKPFQTRAEKLLSVNQIQLRRYYELNLQQARAVFVVGISCIGAGVAVVGLTFWLVSWLSNQPLGGDKLYTQLVVALVGAVGTVLTNYVAHVYFKLHGSITQNLMAFHRQLASTHDLFFANVLAAGIDDPVAREDVLLKLTLAIADRKRTAERAGLAEDKQPAA
jgi:hypothetical protein